MFSPPSVHARNINIWWQNDTKQQTSKIVNDSVLCDWMNSNGQMINGVSDFMALIHVRYYLRPMASFVVWHMIMCACVVCKIYFKPIKHHHCYYNKWSFAFHRLLLRRIVVFVFVWFAFVRLAFDLILICSSSLPPPLSLSPSSKQIANSLQIGSYKCKFKWQYNVAVQLNFGAFHSQSTYEAIIFFMRLKVLIACCQFIDLFNAFMI